MLESTINWDYFDLVALIVPKQFFNRISAVFSTKKIGAPQFAERLAVWFLYILHCLSNLVHYNMNAAL